jgi:phytanoyl-CoA hydroxylase
MPMMNHSRDQVFLGKITEPVDESRAVPIEGKAGTAILMHGMTPHASTTNTLMHPRRTFIVSYHAADAFPIYFGEMTVNNELHTRIVRGEPASLARFSANEISIPRYPGVIVSLYELQELPFNKKPLKKIV